MRFHFAAIAASCLALVSVSACTQDFEALYQKRFDILMGNGGYLKSYSPMEPVTGSPNPTPLPLAKANELSINKQVLDNAAAYAQANNSSAFMVWRNGVIQDQVFFGNTTAATPLLSKSLSKPLSAIAIGRAIQIGAIKSVDQPVADFITEWKDTPKADMLIRHTLDMRSGFLAQGYSPDPDHPWNRAFISYEHGKVLIHDYPMVDKPGTTYAYSNATAELVALIIERATGQRYGDFIGKEVLAKIGAPGGEIWVDRPGGLAHSGCCMYLPAESWMRMAILLLQEGKYQGEQVIPASFVANMKKGTPENPHYGMGVWIGGEYTERRGFTGPGGPGPQVLHSEPYLDKDLYLFDGNSNQVVYTLPNYNMIVLRMGATPPKEPEWDNSHLPNMLVKGVVDE